MRMSEDDWDAVLDTNLKGAFLASKAAFRPMMRQRSGRIVNLTSVIGLVGNAGQANYAAAKAGLIGLTKSLAKEVRLARDHRQRGGAGIHRDPADRGAAGRAEGRNSEADAARPVRFGRRRGGGGRIPRLAGCAFITGHVLTVDGGLFMA